MAFVTITKSSANVGTQTGLAPCVPTRYQTAADFQDIVIDINISSTTVNALENVSFVAKMTQMQLESRDQPLAIEFAGYADADPSAFVPIPIVWFADDPTITSEWVANSSTAIYRYLPCEQHAIASAYARTSWDTKIVVAENANPDYDVFCGVAYVNLSSGSATAFEGRICASARYDFNSVATYYRSR